MLRATGVFDTDDGRAAGIHFRGRGAVRPRDHHPRHRPRRLRRQAPALPRLQSACLPAPGSLRARSRRRGGAGPRARRASLFVVRFVAMVAVHDTNEAGLDLDAKRRLIAELSERGRVLVTSEDDLPPDLEPHRLRIPAHRMHDALAFARLYVGDSQTMAAEAAILGTPSFGAAAGPGGSPTSRRWRSVTSWCGRSDPSTPPASSRPWSRPPGSPASARTGRIGGARCWPKRGGRHRLVPRSRPRAGTPMTEDEGELAAR